MRSSLLFSALLVIYPAAIYAAPHTHSTQTDDTPSQTMPNGRPSHTKKSKVDLFEDGMREWRRQFGREHDYPRIVAMQEVLALGPDSFTTFLWDLRSASGGATDTQTMPSFTPPPVPAVTEPMDVATTALSTATGTVTAGLTDYKKVKKA
ncbi:hypothetical protein MMC21_006758 [Puttea exsequens]|nr:hypothetical protein [Puttea exsequens]